MTLDSRIQFALDQFIENDYFATRENVYSLEEIETTGKSILTVTVIGENLCIKDFDSKNKCNFLKRDSTFGMQKSVDHIIIKKNGDEWSAYLIEMKTSVGSKTWGDIKLKMRTCYLTVQAIAVFLGIRIKHFFAYTSYEKEKFIPIATTTNPRMHAPLLGEHAWDSKKDEWDANKIRIKINEFIELPHTAIQMTRSTDGNELIGAIKI